MKKVNGKCKILYVGVRWRKCSVLTQCGRRVRGAAGGCVLVVRRVAGGELQAASGGLALCVRVITTLVTRTGLTMTATVYIRVRIDYIRCAKRKSI